MPSIPSTDSARSIGSPSRSVFERLAALSKNGARPAVAARVAPPPRPAAPASAPAPAGKSRAAAKPAKKRAPRNPLKVFGLDDPALAMLIAPSEYIDCRDPVMVVDTHAEPDDTLRIYRLRFSGQAFGRDAMKSRIWAIGTPDTPDLAPTPDILNLASIPQKTWFQTRSTCLTLLDDRGTEITCWVFGLPTQWRDLEQDTVVWVRGRIEMYGRTPHLQLQQRLPEYAIDRVWARYRGRAGVITAARVESAVYAASHIEGSFELCAAHICERTGLSEADLVEQELRGTGLDNTVELLNALHAPRSLEEGLAACAVARRLTTRAMAVAAARRHQRAASAQAPIAISPQAVSDLAEMVAAQGRSLTGDQRKVVDRIVERLAQQQPLSALLSGDVGTGKTLAFLLPAVAAHMAGAQVAIVAPVKLLADQIAREIRERFGPVAHVERVDGAISDPGAILVGTQGLINAARKASYIPHLLIFDEQQRLSTDQREACVGERTHTIEVSATPIPRTLAVTLYDQIEQLKLTECPVRKSLHTRLVAAADRSVVVAAIRAALARGERCAVIYPRVNPQEDGSPHECVTGAFALFQRAFPNDAVMLHGDLPPADIEQALEQFRSGHRRLAVASTILEIGIDVPSISVMVARDAEHFGMSQLHQLRGRLARNGGEGRFYMVVDDPDALSDESQRRMEALCSSTDGYQIAESDLVLRGFGDLDGDAQSGDSSATSSLFRNLRLQVADFLAQALDAETALRQPQRGPQVTRQAARALTSRTTAKAEIPPEAEPGPSGGTDAATAADLEQQRLF